MNHSPRDTLSISPPALTFCSAEAFQNRIFRPGGRVGGKRRHSQEIREIHVDAINEIFLSSRQYLAYICFLPLIRTAGEDTFYHSTNWSPIPSSSEWKSKHFTFTFQRLDFPGWNNIVWGVKQYCLRNQTQVFDEWNNIVWALKCKFFGLKMFINLK